MTSFGYPDWQRYAQWFGQPLFQNAALAIGAGSHTDGPIVVANYSSIVLAIQPTGGTITATVKQSLHGAPSALVLSEQFIVPAGSTLFEAIVLLGNVVELDLQGSAGGETVAYALVPTNTSSNAQVITQATVNIQHGGILVAAEPTIDFEDANGFTWAPVDDGANTRVKVPAPLLTRASSLPGSPTDGQLAVLDLSASFAGVEWLCMYKASTTFWDVIGGPPLPIVGSTTGSAASNTWYECGFVAVPNAGDYVVEFVGADLVGPAAVEGYFVGVAIAGGVPAVPAPEIVTPTETGRGSVPGAARLLTGFTAGQHASLMFNSFTVAGGQIQNISGLVHPRRIK